MRINVVMPQLGESVVEGEIIRWLKQTGAAIERDESMVEVKTDKATVEVPAPASGVLAEQTAKEGDVVEVGKNIAIIETSSERAATAVEQPPAAPRKVEQATPRAVEPEKPAPPPKEAEQPVTEPEAPREPLVQKSPEPKPKPAAAAVPVAPPEEKGPAARMTPLARRLAREKGIDPASITGSGAGGRVTHEDVLKAAESKAAPQPTPQPEEKAKPAAPEQPTPVGPDDEAVPLSPMRRRIAARMLHSKTTIPHVTTSVEADMTAVAELREKHRAASEQQGMKLTYMPFIMKACADALLAIPEVNSSWGGDKLILHHRVHLGIAVSVEKGLAVPVMRNAERMSIKQMTKRLAELAAGARAGKLEPDETQGSTFTITNPGVFGAVFSTPIINPPEAAILGLCRIADVPAAVEGKVVIRKRMHLCLSYDHRIVDGETALKFLGHIAETLEKAQFDMEG